MGQSQKRLRNCIFSDQVPKRSQKRATAKHCVNVEKKLEVMFIISIIITKFKLRYVALVQLNEESAKYMKLNLNSYKIHTITMEYFFVEIKHVSLPRDCNNKK